ncbi:TetR family transcriptional regulator C-terminal domain-containing protein [Streptomyces sp. NEAU-sy36]|uniref:TetR/AcrR family transcriptional regulator n=1 Tax=unclassified Streptomyces TaxID=2593676 RepID=UPI0015D59A64|nr:MULTISPECIES: TetR family transcriptional regulator C-terminal domain-containing protein [unclassified Streptomyces]QLJ01720.1 TetR family transcriptional regulator C-terminal domain-containing protein [Streptomyces sp. NEAU-sy36]
MSSSVQRKRIRKDPAARRAEIVTTAAAVALAEGLECVTLRRIGEELAVRPGLISHYFPSAEELVAEAFGHAATAELDRLLPGAGGGAGEPEPGTAADRAEPSGAEPSGAGAVEAGPLARLRRFLGRTTGEEYDAISRLWINARHLSRYRPLLRERVARQEAAWRGRLEGLIRDGVAADEFRTADPLGAAVQILVVLDGLGVHVNTVTPARPAAVLRMAHSTAERELGLPAGALDQPEPAEQSPS